MIISYQIEFATKLVHNLVPFHIRAEGLGVELSNPQPIGPTGVFGSRESKVFAAMGDGCEAVRKHGEGTVLERWLTPKRRPGPTYTRGCRCPKKN